MKQKHQPVPRKVSEKGKTEGKHCSVCNEVLVAQTVISAKGHTVVIDAAKEPTCTETGLTEGKHCSVCNEVLVEQAEIAAKGHTEVIDPAEAATCTETGLTEGKHCSVCNAVLIAQTEIVAAGHSWNAGEVTTEPTCEAEGVKTYACTACGETKTEAIAAKGHTEVTDEAEAATCTETGLTEGKHCSVCNEVIVAQNEIPAKGHTEVVDSAVAATCTESGKTEGKHCSVCNEVLLEQKVVPATGHTEVTDKAKAATCTETGLTEGKHCSVCNEVIVAQSEIPAKGHTEVIDPAKTSPCTETGLTEGKHCSVCNEVLVEQTEIAAKGHTEVTDEAEAATCTETGLTEGKHCSVCNEVIVAQNEIPAKGHTEVVDSAAEPTCTEKGKTEGKHCSVCNEVLVAQNEIPAKGHSWNAGEVTTKPTCEAEGVRTYTCQTCGETKTEAIKAKGHTEVIDEAKAPTCTEKGKTEGKHCSVCNEVLVEQTEIAAKGHTEVTDAAKAPTCTETGMTEGKHCSVCNEVIVAQDVIPANGHTEVIDSAVRATCTETGLTEGKHCSVCNEVLVEQTEIAAAGHSWNAGEVTTKPTCEAEGVRTYTCTACGETKTEAIKAKGHTEVIDAAVEATCTEPGLTAGKHCSDCGKVIEAQTEIAAAGHDYHNYICTRCGATDPNKPSHSGPRDYVINQNNTSGRSTIAYIVVKQEKAEDGSKISVVRISDRILDEIIKKADTNDSEHISICASSDGLNGLSASTNRMEVPAELIRKISESDKYSFTIRTQHGEFEFSSKDLAKLLNTTADNDEGVITITVDELTKEKLSDAQRAAAGEEGSIITVSITDSNGSKAEINSKGKRMLLEVPNELKDKSFKAISIDDDGFYRELEGELITKDGKQYYAFESCGASAYTLAETTHVANLMAQQQKKIAKISKGLKRTKIELKTMLTAKGKIRLKWKKSAGYKVDSFQVYRSTKKSGFGKKPFFKASANKTTYLNTKNLKHNKRYYYKVRGVRQIGDKLYYTGWSNISSQFIK